MSGNPINFKKYGYRRRKDYQPVFGIQSSSSSGGEIKHNVSWLDSLKKKADKGTRPAREIRYPEDYKGVYSIRYCDEDDGIVVGYGSGAIEIRDRGSIKVVKPAEDFGYPVSCIRVAPESDKFFCSTTQGFVLEGSIEHGTYKTYIEETQNEINSFDLSPDLNYMVTGGRDSIIRQYDANLGKLIYRYGNIETGKKDKCHKSRVFCVKAHHRHHNIFLSGGWDNIVKVWDLRNKSGPVSDILGPHICGDAIDVRDETIVTGSWAAENSLQLWDFRNTQLINTIIPINRPKSVAGEFPYCVQFFRGDLIGQTVVVGGSGTGSLEIVDTKEKKSNVSFKTSKAVLAIDSTSSHVVFGGMEDVIRIAAV